MIHISSFVSVFLETRLEAITSDSCAYVRIENETRLLGRGASERPRENRIMMLIMKIKRSIPVKLTEKFGTDASEEVKIREIDVEFDLNLRFVPVILLEISSNHVQISGGRGL